jgi:hypothetical protein
MKEGTINNDGGIISIGNNNSNTIQNIQKNTDFDWKGLKQDIDILLKNANPIVKKAAKEVSEAVEKKDTETVKSWLKKWIPCIGDSIKTSYYILGIASKLGILHSP